MLHIISTCHHYQLKIPFKDICRLKIYKFVNKVPGEQKRCYQERAATVLSEESAHRRKGSSLLGWGQNPQLALVVFRKLELKKRSKNKKADCNRSTQEAKAGALSGAQGRPR